MTAADAAPATTPQPLSTSSSLSERTPDGQGSPTRPAYAVHAFAHELSDSLPVYASNEAEDGSDGIRWSSTDGLRRTMRKVSRRVLPLAAAAYGISQVGVTSHYIALYVTCVYCPRM